MTEKNGSSKWMWFIRGTFAVLLGVAAWALNLLTAIDKNQVRIADKLTAMDVRITKLEEKNARDIEERFRWLREHRGEYNNER